MTPEQFAKIVREERIIFSSNIERAEDENRMLDRVIVKAAKIYRRTHPDSAIKLFIDSGYQNPVKSF